MAEFKIHELEGTRYVDVHLNHEMVRVEAGALCYLTGDIQIHSQLVPSVGGLIKSLLANEAVYRPTYSGTGDVAFKMRRSTKDYFGRFTSGEGWVRVYEGDGRILLNPAPYWRYRVFTQRGGNPDTPSQTTA